jgi:P-type conjugative transfer protein TrbJ
MTRKHLIITAAAAALFTPVAAFGTQIVFDPTNYTQLVQQLSQDVQLVEDFHQEVQNQLAMLQNWGYSQLAGILQSMNVFQNVFSQAGVTYSSTDPGNTLNTEFPSLSVNFSGITDAGIQAMRQQWDQEERQVLIENRTVQNDTYRSLAPAAQRMNDYVQQSNSAPGTTAAVQASNEELATVVAQVQTLQAQEITDGRGEVERDAEEQAEEAYSDQQDQSVRADSDNPQQPTTTLVDAFPMASN